MAKNRPVKIWVIKQRPRREPKFHQTEMLEGAGRSTSASLAIFRIGWVFRRLAIKVFVVELQRWFFKSLVLVRFRAKIMAYIILTLLIGIVLGVISVASNPSPYFAALGLVLVAGVGCGVLMGHGGSFLSLVLFLIYLGGMLVVFAYCAALAAEPYPEAWGEWSVLGSVLGYLLLVFGGVSWF
ncbi:unnamed protein product [Lota lota]